jgi:hypothetical protein
VFDAGGRIRHLLDTEETGLGVMFMRKFAFALAAIAAVAFAIPSAQAMRPPHHHHSHHHHHHPKGK